MLSSPLRLPKSLFLPQPDAAARGSDSARDQGRGRGEGGRPWASGRPLVGRKPSVPVPASTLGAGCSLWSEGSAPGAPPAPGPPCLGLPARGEPPVGAPRAARPGSQPQASGPEQGYKVRQMGGQGLFPFFFFSFLNTGFLLKFLFKKSKAFCARRSWGTAPNS